MSRQVHLFRLIRLVLGSLGLAAGPAARATEQAFARTFPVSAGARFDLDTYRGRVAVLEGQPGEIRVEVRMQVQTDDTDKSARSFQTVQFQWGSSPGGVSVRVRDPVQTAIRFDWQSDSRVDLSCKVFLPRGCAFNVEVADGSAEVGNLAGDVSVHVGRGTLYLRRIQGSVRARLDNGNLVLSRCSGDADLEAGFGSIQVGTVGGRASLRAPNGGIELQHAGGPAVLSAVKGDVVLGLPRQLGGDVKADVSGGTIYLKLEAGCACVLKASSVWGHVRTVLPIVVQGGGIGKRRLEGTLNGGGPVVVAHANGGDVKIEADVLAVPSSGPRTPRRSTASR
jgi:hypothetical protein